MICDQFDLDYQPILSGIPYTAVNGDQFIIFYNNQKYQENKTSINQTEIEMAINSKDSLQIQKYLAKVYESYHYIIKEKLDGLLEELFKSNEIINLDKQVRMELIATLLYQIIQGYDYIRKQNHNESKSHLYLNNICYKKINGYYIIKITNYEDMKLTKRNCLQTDVGVGYYVDKLDVYTLGVCLYKLMFGMTVQYKDCEPKIPNQEQKDGYHNFYNLLKQMLCRESKKRISWTELYQLLYQFPQILAIRGRADKFVTDCYSYLAERLQQSPFNLLLDQQMLTVALEFIQLLQLKDLTIEQQFLIVTVLKFVFDVQIRVVDNLTEDQLEYKLQKLRSARYISIIAHDIQLSLISKYEALQGLLFDNKNKSQFICLSVSQILQMSILKAIKTTRFQLMDKNRDVIYFEINLLYLDKQLYYQLLDL